MIALDKAAEEALIAKLTGMAQTSNVFSFRFAVALYEDTKDVDWKNSCEGKMQFMERLANKPEVLVDDAGCLRQVTESGKFISEHFNGDCERLSKMSYWRFHDIARSNLNPFDQEKNIELKKGLVEDILSGELLTGKLRAKINEIKDHEDPSTFENLLSYYNSWNFQRPDKRFGIEHPGQIPGQIVLNVLYHYCPVDSVVIDPMAGGGSTHDVCEYLNQVDDYAVELAEIKYQEELKRYEEGDTKKVNPPKKREPREYGFNYKCTSYDLAPRRDFIEERNSLEDDWNVSDVDLVFLDPPYFNMMEDDYVKNAFTESRDSFLDAIKTITTKAYDALKPGGICALIIQPQTEKSVDFASGEVSIDWPYECMKIMEYMVGFKPYIRIQTPLSTEQFLPQDVNRAKKFDERHRLLGTTRDLILMKK